MTHIILGLPLLALNGADLLEIYSTCKFATTTTQKFLRVHYGLRSSHRVELAPLRGRSHAGEEQGVGELAQFAISGKTSRYAGIYDR